MQRMCNIFCNCLDIVTIYMRLLYDYNLFFQFHHLQFIFSISSLNFVKQYFIFFTRSFAFVYSNLNDFFSKFFIHYLLFLLHWLIFYTIVYIWLLQSKWFFPRFFIDDLLYFVIFCTRRKKKTMERSCNEKKKRNRRKTMKKQKKKKR